MKIDPELKDGLFWQILEDLSACLCSTLADAKGPELCFCGVLPGDTVDEGLAAVGSCSGGMAWVRLANSYASTTFPDADAIAGCSVLLAAQFEIGVLRPIILGNDRRNPTSDELVAATRVQLSDMTAMHRAIRCCVGGSEVDFVYALGDYTPEGPDGGLLGGSWTLTVQQSF